MNSSSSGKKDGKRYGSKDVKAKKKKTKITCLVINDVTMHPHSRLSVDRVKWKRCYIDINEFLHHPCRPVKGHNECQLHKYFGLENKQSPIMYCNKCLVHLCLDCYKPFHEIEEKDELKKRIENIDE